MTPPPITHTSNIFHPPIRFNKKSYTERTPSKGLSCSFSSSQAHFLLTVV